MNRLLATLGATTAFCVGATLGTSALAAGALVEGDGSALGGLVVDANIANARAVFFQQGDAVTAIIQAATRSEQSIGSAWILPIGGDILKPPAAADPSLIGELLRTTDPIYEETIFPGCATGCTAMGDSGEDDFIADMGVFDASKAGATWSYFGPDAADAAIDSLVDSGYGLSNELATGVQSHAASGGSFVVMFFTADRSAAATPAIVVRYQASEMMMPQALTALSAEALVRTSVLTITSAGATGPVGVPHAQPTLGVPLYAASDTPQFYNARAELALDEAGEGAWLLEYSNYLDELDLRSELLLDSSSLWNGGLPWAGLDALVNRGLLDEFDSREVWITRWRTHQKSSDLEDQVFAPDPSVPAYEVYLEASQFDAAAAWAWPLPALLGFWAFGRRRREV